MTQSNDDPKETNPTPSGDGEGLPPVQIQEIGEGDLSDVDGGCPAESCCGATCYVTTNTATAGGGKQELA